ncbi:hypothetical protein CARUB_v10016250mg [Capsella rubella]|uniref:F-box domain-containing protein n=1 Tax=Capsella rubella TaxID=81985 RepID=R0HSZ7_9BRAS|nr:F-box/LRR-repeat protein At2g42730 [Capsella rubella]EOA32924.1 hypothetical protein CARUB_v10016250mg [Capsella rubella]
MSGQDAISRLPDEVLACILSSLTTKQAASTSVLSKRWRNVFAFVNNLDLDDRDSVRTLARHRRENSKRFKAFVSSFLDTQGSSKFIKKFTLKIHVNVQNRYGLDPACVESWICNVLDRGVVDLDLSIITFQGKSPPVLTLDVMRKTLVKLSLNLGRCFIVKLPQDISLPLLRTLCLNSVGFDRDCDVVGTLLSRCPFLEEIYFEESNSKKPSLPVQIQWSSSSLKRLSIRFNDFVKISFDFPNLVFFELSYESGSEFLNVNLDSLIEARLNHRCPTRGYDYSHVNLIHLINGISNVRTLHLCSLFLDEMIFTFYFTFNEILPMFHNLVCLSIESKKSRGWKILPHIIRNSPNLETLIFKGLKHRCDVCSGDVCDCYLSSRRNRPSCLTASRVKVLEILDYRVYCRSDESQLKHFLAKLTCLEVVKLSASNLDMPPTGWHKSLRTIPRASRNCKFQVIP